MDLAEALKRNRILVYALTASLACHLACLSACAIVAPPADRPVTFSRVSFLGAAIERAAMEVRMSPREITFMESRYLDRIAGSTTEAFRGRFPAVGAAACRPDTRFNRLIASAVSGPKIEPGGDLK